jgi:hypothetical protein
MPVEGRSAPDRRPDQPATEEGAHREMDGPAVVGETRTRAAYYAALRAADPDRPRAATDGAAARRSAWEAPGLADHPARPGPDSLHLPPERAVHILDGDASGGGHRHGTGRARKTEFPADWGDQKITDTITDVARYPDSAPLHQAWNNRWLARGIREGVDIVVIAQADGRIWSAWPLEGGAGVVRNPTEAT